jgi:glycine betaine/proline transport system substrate-binding protein
MKRMLTTLAAGLFAAVITAAPAAMPVLANDDRVDIGWTAWGDAEVVSKMAAILIGQGLKKDVELTLSDVAIQYRGVADGDLDAMLMSWQPLTHKTFLQKYEGKLVDAGELYAGARLGLAVPDYVPAEKVRTIADLAKPEVREMLGGRIVGIDPNSGIMGMTGDAVRAYGLDDYAIEPGTGPKMAKLLGEAIEAGQPVVVTAWTPHWVHGKYDLRFLEDPENVYGDTERVHAVVRKGFDQDMPQVHALLQAMHFELDELQSLMADAHERGHRVAVVDWINANMDTVRGWLDGRSH